MGVTMGKYRVTFETEASYSVEVEADNEVDAEDVAYDEADYPYFSGGMDGDLGDWWISEIEELN
jgi:hypothetical protein